MKKNKSSTEDLLARLGASLKESPLKAHARGVSGNAPENTPAKVVEVTKENKVAAPTPQAQQAKDLILTGAVLMENKVAPMAKNVTLPQVTPAVQVTKVSVASQPQRKTIILSNERMSDEQVEQIRRREEIYARLGASEQKQERLAAVPVEALEELLKVHELNNAMRAQTAQYRAEVEALKAAPQVAPVAPAAPVYPTYGSKRNSYQGWRTSTVGLYPEDYEKARAVMMFMQQQTGEFINLSRVMKIALRSLEIGPELVEMNASLKAKDGRLLSRRTNPQA